MICAEIEVCELRLNGGDVIVGARQGAEGYEGEYDGYRSTDIDFPASPFHAFWFPLRAGHPRTHHTSHPAGTGSLLPTDIADDLWGLVL